MYVIHAIRRTLAFLYGNPISANTLFSSGSHTGTAATVQYPFWGGVSFIQPARSAVFRSVIAAVRKFCRIIASVN